MSSGVFVVHVMVVPTPAGRQMAPEAGSVEKFGALVAAHVREELTRDSLAFYEGYERFEDGVFSQDFVVQIESGWDRVIQVSGEYCWIRPITTEDGGDEIFDSTSSLLVLRPRNIVEIATDFGAEVFKNRHGTIVGDAEAELQNAAFELLLAELGNDYETCYCRPYPELLPEVIVDAIRGRNLLKATRQDMWALSGEIIAAFEAKKYQATES